MPRAKSLSLISSHAINVLARLAAKRAVQDELRAQGVRVTLIKPSVIAERARAYLDANPSLYEEAYQRAKRMGLIKPMPILDTPDLERNS